MAFENGREYKDGNPSSIGQQLIPFYWQRKALIDLKKEQFFGQLADVTAMPKNYGKTIKRFHYIPLLDDRNINDQGIDATGASITDEVTITVTDPSGMSRYAVGNGASAAAALTAAQAKALDIFKNMGMSFASYAAAVTALTAANWTIVEGDAVNNSGNLYGSSRDVGTIVGKLPTISENGGRVNRVGFTRLTLEAAIENFGFFDEYTEDSVQFDNDAELMQHISRETLRAANEIVEGCIQIDLLNGANVVFYGGDATSAATITGETGGTASELDYETLVRVETMLNNNRCPKDTTIITGSRMTDTRTIGACRYAYVGSELKLNLLQMEDFHGNAAFIPVQEYAEAGKLAAGEIGSISNFRFIENPQMFYWEGAGAAVINNAGYLESNGHYNVYPMLIVGSGCFTTIGFQTDGENTKFKILHKKPGSATADRNDPYGKTGFYSIQWWYGTMILRPEWLACIKVVAKQ
jgi:N4-gp56 family major capsid protein